MDIERVRRIRAGIQHAEESAALSFEQSVNMLQLCNEVERLHGLLIQNARFIELVNTDTIFESQVEPLLDKIVARMRRQARG